MTALGSLFRKINFYFNKFPYYFLCSNIGQWKLNNLSTETFKAHRVTAIPNAQFYCPLLVYIFTHENGMELSFFSDTDTDILKNFVGLVKEEVYSLERKQNRS